MRYEFTVEHCPVAQPRMKASSRGGMVRLYEPTKTTTGKRHPIVAYKFAVSDTARNCCETPLQGPVFCSVEFVMPRVQSDRKKANIRHAKKPDIDNCLKSLFDALNGIAWIDDSQVCELIAKKRVAEIGEEPHVVVLCTND